MGRDNWTTRAGNGWESGRRLGARASRPRRFRKAKTDRKPPVFHNRPSSGAAGSRTYQGRLSTNSKCPQMATRDSRSKGLDMVYLYLGFWTIVDIWGLWTFSGEGRIVHKLQLSTNININQNINIRPPEWGGLVQRGAGVRRPGRARGRVRRGRWGGCQGGGLRRGWVRRGGRV